VRLRNMTGSEIRNGKLLVSPTRGRPMLLALDEITAALMFQKPEGLLASRALPNAG